MRVSSVRRQLEQIMVVGRGKKSLEDMIGGRKNSTTALAHRRGIVTISIPGFVVCFFLQPTTH